ncbi:putative cytochrome P450 [Helianthus debilis subsp. tardiflorus]
MHYLHAAASEAMQMFPPVPVDTKACLKPDVWPDGTFVGEGWFVTYHTYAMGRMESVWGTDCNEFRPERWLEEENGGGTWCTGQKIRLNIWCFMVEQECV